MNSSIIPTAHEAMAPPAAPLRLLGVDPFSRGFGYALFENTNLIDWGIVTVEESIKNDRCVQRLVDLLTKYQPDRLILEDTSPRACRRSDRVKSLIEAFRATARVHDVAVNTMGWLSIKRFWTDLVSPSKFDVACEIAKNFPELRRRLPKKRKIWDSQDPKLSIFNAVALVLTYVFLRLARKSSPS